MNLGQLFKLEAKKYSLFYFVILFIGMMLINLFIVFLQVMGDINHFTIYKVFDALSLLAIIVNPLLIASIYNNGIQQEAKHNMWKIIYTSGLSVQTVNQVKFWYLQGVLWLFTSLMYLIIFGILMVYSVPFSLSAIEIAYYYLGTVAVNFALSGVHYYLALKFENPLANMAGAIFGSLIGIAVMLISELMTYVIPYAWYILLMRLDAEKVGETFQYHLRNFTFYPILAGFLLGILGVYFGQKTKVGE